MTAVVCGFRLLNRVEPSSLLDRNLLWCVSEVHYQPRPSSWLLCLYGEAPCCVEVCSKDYSGLCSLLSCSNYSCEAPHSPSCGFHLPFLLNRSTSDKAVSACPQSFKLSHVMFLWTYLHEFNKVLIWTPSLPKVCCLALSLPRGPYFCTHLHVFKGGNKYSWIFKLTLKYRHVPYFNVKMDLVWFHSYILLQVLWTSK